jgi:hypothetical protein
MLYRIELSSQGGKPFAYHERPDKDQAVTLAERLKARHTALIVTVKESI